MSCNAGGRCHFCCKKHTVSVFGGDEVAYALLQKLNLKLVVFNTICSPCIVKLEDSLRRDLLDVRSPLEGTTSKETHIEIPAEFTRPSTDNLETTEKSRVVNEISNFPPGETMETDAEVKGSVDSIGAENKAGTNDSEARVNTENVRKRQLTCEFCEKAFSHAGDLNKHRRKHTGEQPYACTTCERRFKTSSNLVRHQQTHLGIKPFRCEICGCAFTRKVKLSAHLVAKHDGASKPNQSLT